MFASPLPPLSPPPPFFRSLYLNECSSVFLGVQFAADHTTCRELLWEIVVSHCLRTEKLGELLECAASIGADLSTLVAKIPRGMEIQNLKAKLLGSIETYRVLVKSHEVATVVSGQDRLSLLRETTHTVRRGVRMTADEMTKVQERRGGAEAKEAKERDGEKRKARNAVIMDRLKNRTRGLRSQKKKPC